jgi:hypothetical protein
MRALLYEGAISGNDRLQAAAERGAGVANLALVSAAHRRRMESFRAAKFGMELPWAWPYKTLHMLYSSGWR